MCLDEIALSHFGKIVLSVLYEDYGGGYFYLQDEIAVEFLCEANDIDMNKIKKAIKELKKYDFVETLTVINECTGMFSGKGFFLTERGREYKKLHNNFEGIFEKEK